MRLWLWLYPALILLAAVASSYPDMRGPGSRHAEDVPAELRAAWDDITTLEVLAADAAYDARRKLVQQGTQRRPESAR